MREFHHWLPGADVQDLCVVFCRPHLPKHSTGADIRLLASLYFT